MWADLQSITSLLTPIEDFQIRYIQIPEDLTHFANVLAGLFGDSPEATQVRRYYTIIRQYYATNQPMRLYLGEQSGQVVATGTLFIDKAIAGIYDIATRPEWRYKGYGTAMFRHLVQEARQQGVTQAVLQASPNALGIYERTGFTKVGVVSVYEN